MSRVFLRADPPRLDYEIDYVSGRAPSAEAAAHLGATLALVADDRKQVMGGPGDVIARGRSAWTVEDLKRLETANRSIHSSQEMATMWVVYVDGHFADNESALGVAYSASSFAIFRDRIDDATTALVNATRIERAVITHEAGHLLALVNIGYRSAIDHEDPEHPNHSRNDESVMFWAVEDLSIKTLLAGGPPDDFDAADRADLEALKRG